GPRGYRATVSATAPVLVPHGTDEAPTSGPMTVVADDQGYLQFDVLAEDPRDGVFLSFGNTGNADLILSDPFVFPGWRTPAIDVLLDGGPAILNLPPDWQAHILQW